MNELFHKASKLRLPAAKNQYLLSRPSLLTFRMHRTITQLQGACMKRFVLGVCSLALFCSISSVASAQMGRDLFKPPSIAKVFKPVIGQGAEYQTTNSSDKKVHTIQMGAV